MSLTAAHCLIACELNGSLLSEICFGFTKASMVPNAGKTLDPPIELISFAAGNLQRRS